MTDLEKLFQIYNDNQELSFQLAKASGCQKEFIMYLWVNNQYKNPTVFDGKVTIRKGLRIYYSKGVYKPYIALYEAKSYETLDEAIDHILKLIYET